MHTTHVQSTCRLSPRVLKATTPIVIAALLLAVSPVPARAQQGKEFARNVAAPILGALMVAGGLALVALLMPKAPLSAEPASLSFTSVQPGSDATQVVKLSNKSKKAMTVETMAIVGDQFVLQEPPHTPYELKPGESMDVRIAFKPAPKRRASGRLAIRTRAAQGGKQRTMEIRLKG